MKRNIVILAGTLIVFVMLGVPGCKKDSADPYGTTSPPPSTTPPNTVIMGPSSFNPATLTVARGVTVTWRNDDGAAHTSTSDSTGWDTGNIPAGTSKTTTFNTPGTFGYHCTYHRAMGMVGTITVQ
jgi:plastocyanin